ncbi:hypothetical protein JRO89_XS13G0211300 [Xanthoceras sorbifolium]|uniref:Cation/H(+) antiporter 24 n=1 Tax=Xanthoceras sorbifolium TaxID=99658 RepID=A0ABQ8H9E1_9ROSI|nr:hypothetical protein JRO89_XS13G0211300 [Xanthoceras sorbifolium]
MILLILGLETWPAYFKMFQNIVHIAADYPYESVPEAINPKYSKICRPTHKDHSLGIFYGENPLEYSFTVMLFEIVFVILTTWIVRFLLKPLKQPRVISEIIGGIIIGPSILGRNKKFTAEFFPDNAQFVLKNLGIMGFMFFLFLAGVKMDMTYVRRSGKKQFYIALCGVILPTVTVAIVAFVTRKYMEKDLARISSIGAISSSLAITSFPVLNPILRELNLLSSEVGRLAMSTAIISDLIGINAIIAFEAVKQGEAHHMNGVWYLISLVILMVFFFTVVRRIMKWIVHRTPEGKAVSQGYVVAILVGVMAMGFLTDMFGMAIANGPLWLGLVIPDGPPLGATLVERTETFVVHFLMPFSFAVVGLYTDVFAMGAVGWSGLAPLFAMVLTGYVSKVVGVLLSSLLYEIPFRDSLTLSLVLSLRGQVELLLFIHWIDKMIVQVPGFTLLVLSTVVMTGIATPMISLLYDPTRPYMVNKRRTIQHHPPNTELRVVVCIHDQETVAGFINLLEVSYPTLNSPLSVYALHLVELVGRGMPVFIDYDEEEENSNETPEDNIHSALKQYQESRGEFNVHAFTAMAPLQSMYQNICELALEHRATLIILPFHKEYPGNLGGTEFFRGGLHSMNVDVLGHAPCSVGILVDKGNFRNPLAGCSLQHSVHQFVVLFLGGADSREALAYADRMAGNPDVAVIVIRFLSHNYEGDNEMEKKLDDGVVTWFWVKNEANERVVYREVVVRNGAETVAAIQALNDDAYYDLWIVGRKQGINPVLLEGLADWSEDNELGIIGDYIASADFGTTSSVLVVQQQILRSRGGAPPLPPPSGVSRGKFPCISGKM